MDRLRSNLYHERGVMVIPTVIFSAVFIAEGAHLLTLTQINQANQTWMFLKDNKAGSFAVFRLTSQQSHN